MSKSDEMLVKGLEWLKQATVRNALGDNITRVSLTSQLEISAHDATQWEVSSIRHPKLDEEGEPYYGILPTLYEFQNNAWFNEGYELFLHVLITYDDSEPEYSMKFY